MSAALVSEDSVGILKPLKPRLRLSQVILEILFVALVGVYAARPYLNPDSKLILNGLEAEWMTNSAYFASHYLQETGRIPLWQPYIGRGEPSVENPITFLLNPISMGPSLVFGAELGIRYSIVLYAVFAGIGGWAIGRLMGFNMPARLLLGVLMLAKGSMPSVAGWGYFQLGVNQAYLPWAVVGALAIVRYPKQRMPVALLAVMLMLLYLGGLLYYILPGAILAAGVAIVFAIRRSPTHLWGVTLDLPLLRRFALAFVLAAALSAVTALPVLLHYGSIGGHPDEASTALYETPLTAAAQLFTPDHYYADLTWSENYDLYTVPVWFAALLFVVMPPFWRFWSRPPEPRITGRILVLGLVCGVFFLFWGTGTNPLMRWANENLPFIGQWRVLSRLLTVVSLWLAVIVALRFDSLWRAIILDDDGHIRRSRLHTVLAGGMVAVCILAVRDPLQNYTRDSDIGAESAPVATCVHWLRTHYSGELTIMVRDYFTLLSYIREGVRFSYRAMDFKPLGQTPTIFPYDLRGNYARFFLGSDPQDRQYWMDHGYMPIADSPPLNPGMPCLMEYPNPLPYAFAAPLDFLDTYVPPDDPMPSAQWRGLTGDQVVALPAINNQIDTIGLSVQSYRDREAVVVLGEVAWPGWGVSLDGKPARLESVGQLIGVVLPADGADHQILFRYDPPLFKVGALITFVTAAAVSLWLLRADRVLARFRSRRRSGAAAIDMSVTAPGGILPPVESGTASYADDQPEVLPFD